MKRFLRLKSLALAFIFLYSNYAIAMEPVSATIVAKATGDAALIAGAAIAPVVVAEGQKLGKALKKGAQKAHANFTALEAKDQDQRTSHRARNPQAGLGYDSCQPLQTQKPSFERNPDTDAKVVNPPAANTRGKAKAKAKSVPVAKSTDTPMVVAPTASKPGKNSGKSPALEFSLQPSTQPNPRSQGIIPAGGAIQVTPSTDMSSYVKFNPTIGVTEYSFLDFSNKDKATFSKANTQYFENWLQNQWRNSPFKGQFKDYKEFVFRQFNCYQFQGFLDYLETLDDYFDDYIAGLLKNENFLKEMRKFLKIGGFKTKIHHNVANKILSYVPFIHKSPYVRNNAIGSSKNKYAFNEWGTAKLKERTRKSGEALAQAITTPATRSKAKKKQDDTLETELFAGVDQEPPSDESDGDAEEEDKKEQPLTIDEDEIRDSSSQTFDHVHKQKHLLHNIGKNPEEINDKLIRALKKAIAEGKMPKSGAYRIHPTIDGHPVTIAGKIIDNVVQLGTAFVVNPTRTFAANAWKTAQATGKIVLGLGGAAALTQEASAEGHAEMDTSSHNGQETKTASSSSSNSSGFSGKTQQTKARAQGKTSPPASPSSMDQSADGKKGLGLKKKPQAGKPRSGGPMCGGDGKVTQPLKKLKHRMSFKQVGRMAPTQLEEDEDPSLSDDEPGLGLTSQRSSRPGASMSSGDNPRHQSQTSGWDIYRVGDPVTKPYNEDLDENVRLARKIARKSPNNWNQREQQFVENNPDLFKSEQKKEDFGQVAMDDLDRSFDSPSGNQPLQMTEEKQSAGEEAFDEEEESNKATIRLILGRTTANVNRSNKDQQFLNDHQDLIEKMKRDEQERDRRLEAEIQAQRRAQDAAMARMEAQNMYYELKEIHRTPPEKRSKIQTLIYNSKKRIAHHLEKGFDDLLKYDLEKALKRLPERRYKDDKKLIRNHPALVKQIQEEHQAKLDKKKDAKAKKEKDWQKLQKHYAKETKKPVQAAYLVRLGKSFEKKRSLKKMNAIQETLRDPTVGNGYKYPISNIPSHYKDLLDAFIQFFGSRVQELVHNELIALIENNNDIYEKEYLNRLKINQNRHVVNISTFIYHFADIARKYNNLDKIKHAFTLVDFCSKLIAVQKAFCDFISKHVGLKEGLQSFWSMLPFTEDVEPHVEFGKKLNELVETYRTEAIWTSIDLASGALSKSLALTYRQPKDFTNKILAEGPGLVRAVNKQKKGSEARLITFVMKQFLYGTSLGLQVSDETTELIKIFVDTINAELEIAQQAGVKDPDCRPLLMPITTIFKQAIEKAIKIAQDEESYSSDSSSDSEIDQETKNVFTIDSDSEKEDSDGAGLKASDSDQKDSDEETSDKEEAKMVNSDKEDSDASDNEKPDTKKSSKQSYNGKKAKSSGTQKGTKRKHQETDVKKSAPTNNTGAAAMDEAKDGKKSDHADDNERLKKRARYKKQLSDGKDEKKEAKIPGNAHDVKIPVLFQANGITQFQSIHQNAYEENQWLNLFGGNLMCGHFSAFNGSRMLDIACAKNPEQAQQAQQDMLSDEAFNAWLIKRHEIIESYEHDAVGNIFGNHIERLLHASNNTFYTDNTSIIEIANVRNSFIQRKGQDPLFVPADNALVEQIHYFRESKTPQLVILNTGRHWICMVFTQDWMWIADSLNIDRTHNAAVDLVRTLFTTRQIPAVAELEQLRNQYRDVPKSAAARDEEKRGQPKPTYQMVLRSLVKNKKAKS